MHSSHSLLQCLIPHYSRLHFCPSHIMPVSNPGKGKFLLPLSRTTERDPFSLSRSCHIKLWGIEWLQLFSLPRLEAAWGWTYAWNRREPREWQKFRNCSSDVVVNLSIRFPLDFSFSGQQSLSLYLELSICLFRNIYYVATVCYTLIGISNTARWMKYVSYPRGTSR